MIARNDENDLFCRRCERHMARIVDGALVAGGIKLFNEARYFCNTCSKPYYYRELLPRQDKKFPAEVYEVLNSLGHEE